MLLLLLRLLLLLLLRLLLLLLLELLLLVLLELLLVELLLLFLEQLEPLLLLLLLELLELPLLQQQILLLLRLYFARDVSHILRSLVCGTFCKRLQLEYYDVLEVQELQVGLVQRVYCRIPQGDAREQFCLPSFDLE